MVFWFCLFLKFYFVCVCSVCVRRIMFVFICTCVLSVACVFPPLFLFVDVVVAESVADV